MKLTTPRIPLLDSLSTVSGAVPTRTAKDILKLVLFWASGNGLALTATDEQIGIRCELPDVEVRSPGSVLLDPRRLTQILRELTCEHVDIEVTDGTATITGGLSEFRLQTEDADGFPSVATFGSREHFTIPADILGPMLARTVFATDSESSRYALGGVLWEVNGDSLHLAATDSRRLSVVEATGQKAVTLGDNAPIVPTRAMLLIERSLPTGAGLVRIAPAANDILVQSGTSTIYSRLVEGRFPRWRDVVPREWEHEVELPVGPLRSAFRQSEIVTTEETRGVDCRFADGMLRLSSEVANIGQSKVEVPITWDAKPLVIRLDPRYVSDMLRRLEPADAVTMRMTDGESPVLFVAGSWRYVVMPLQREK